MNKKYAISSCLLGVNCRYSGDSSEIDELVKIFNSGNAIPICPETLGGLKTPREPAEIIISTDGTGEIISESGKDLSEEFATGAKKALLLTKIFGAEKAILKSCSPSCGSVSIYDGNFTGTLIKGRGVTAELFIKKGIKVYNEKNWDKNDN